MPPLFAGIEAGGTKFVCAVGSGPQDMRAQTTILTTSPTETMSQVIEFLHVQESQHGRLSAIGVAAFGPLDPNLASPTYGYITSTPKPGWGNFNFVGYLKQHFEIPISFDTDVNGAALGEWRWGAAQGLHTFIYITIGTGLGGGAMVNGRLLHGLVHPEMGHMLLPHDRQADPFPGWCPYHGDCFEGLAAGPAMQKRWGQRAETLPDDHPGWELEAHYLALGVANLTCAFSPQRFILGGGVMQRALLFPLVRSKVQQILNGYVQSPQILHEIDQFIVPPALGGRAGVIGAIALAEQALEGH
jgi:fructokinase